MALPDAELKKILLDLSYLSPEDAQHADQEAEERHISFRQALTELELITPDLYENAIAEYYKLEYFDPKKYAVTAEIAAQLPEAVARRYNCVVVARPAVDQVSIATSDPGTAGMEDAIRLNLDQETPFFPDAEKEAGEKKAKKAAPRVKYAGTVTWLYGMQSTIENLFVHYRKPLATRFQAIIDKQKKVAPEILQEIFNDAIQMNASDIHFEPQEEQVMVRFRVDGVLHEAGMIPKQYYEGVLNRIKIASNMHIDEHFSAQDGAIRYRAPSGMKVDMRVSILPLVDGEKVVMRLLSEFVRKLTLSSLGFSDENR